MSFYHHFERGLGIRAPKSPHSALIIKIMIKYFNYFIKNTCNYKKIVI